MVFLKLTDSDTGEPVLVNAECVEVIWPNRKGSKVEFNDGDLNVQETLEEIETLIVVTKSARQQKEKDNG